MEIIVLYLFCLFFIVDSVNIPNLKMGKIIGASLIGTTLSSNSIDVTKFIEHPVIKNSVSVHPRNANGLMSSSISIERNNIYLYGDISAESCEALKNKINELDFNSELFRLSYGTEPPPINIHIQSNGGSLMNSFYIVDLIESIKTKVNTYIDGYSASAASLINVSGNKRYMTKNSMMLIHQLYSGREGKFAELEDDSENMKLMMGKIKDIYLKKSYLTPDKLDNILKRDIWMDAETCKKYGLIDEII